MIIFILITIIVTITNSIAMFAIVNYLLFLMIVINFINLCSGIVICGKLYFQIYFFSFLFCKNNSWRSICCNDSNCRTSIVVAIISMKISIMVIISALSSWLPSLHSARGTVGSWLVNRFLNSCSMTKQEWHCIWYLTLTRFNSPYPPNTHPKLFHSPPPPLLPFSVLSNHPHHSVLARVPTDFRRTLISLPHQDAALDARLSSRRDFTAAHALKDMISTLSRPRQTRSVTIWG